MLQVIILIEIGHQYKILRQNKIKKIETYFSLLTIQKAGENKISKIGNIL